MPSLLSEEEAAAVEVFAREHVAQSKATQEYKRILKPLTAEAVSLRTRLLAALRATGAAALTLGTTGQYVRAKTTTSKRKMTEQMVHDAVDFFDCPEDLKDCTARADVVTALAKRLQAQRVVSGSTVIVSRVAPHASQVVKAADDAALKDAASLTALLQQIKAHRAAFREAAAARAAEIDRVTSCLLDMLHRMDKSSHKVIIHGGADGAHVYFIRRKPAARRAKKRRTASSGGEGPARAPSAAAVVADIQRAANAAVPSTFQVADFTQCRRAIAETLLDELAKERRGGGGGSLAVDGDDDQNGVAADDADDDADEAAEDGEERLTFDRSTRV